jgi:type IV secretory pathway VirB10-like protein
MKNNETGEFELVVGDRQLLSAFFIVVLLCAVAFAMGYVVGQNAPKSGKQAAENPPVPAASASPGESRPQPLPPAPSATHPASAAADVPAKPADGPPQPTTQPAQSSEPRAPETQAAASPAPAAAGLVPADDLPVGSYWQVMSVQQPQAEVMRTTLKDHGFGVILSPGPKGLTRVLVGPYGDTQTFGKAKTDLENAGMHPVRYKP